MFYFHHMSLCQEVPNRAGQVILDPAFWNESKGGADIKKFTSALKSASGHELENSADFVITDSTVILPLLQIFNYLFFIISEAEYANEMPVNYSDEWDKSLKIGDLNMLGWSVFAFSEPAFLYGTYPVKFEGNNTIFDEKYINEWGLIKSEELAKEVAATNNTNGDANDSYWKVLGICVDNNTFSRLRNVIANQYKE